MPCGNSKIPEKEESDSADSDSSNDDDLKTFRQAFTRKSGTAVKPVSEDEDELEEEEDSDQQSTEGEEEEEEEEEDNEGDDEEEQSPLPQKRKAQSDIPSTSALKKLKTTDEDVSEETRKSIREELRQMSLEEIEKLKEELGVKLFNSAVLGRKKPEAKAALARKVEFKRENKNRPREMSSKKTVSRLRDVVGVSSERNAAVRDRRDPRFEATSGDFDKKEFRENYKFVDEIKAKERKQLQKELEEEDDPERIKQIKYLIQRYDNQEREKKRHLARTKVRDEERERNSQLATEGKAPRYASKKEARNRELVEKYDELKKSGGLEKYLKKKNRQIEAKEKKKFMS